MPMSPVQAAIKRTIDVIVSFVALLFLSPLLLFIAFTVRLTSPGPALFSQQRLGKAGIPFLLYKFRSMFVNAPDIRNLDGSTYNAEDDTRVTKFGRFLRKTSLDELPQLINILKGGMSLVGPRPDLVSQLQYYAPEDRQKLQVKPGVTGPAQISGRNSILWEHRRKMDAQYVENYSLRQDCQIMVKTIPYVFLRKGIYQDSLELTEQPHPIHTPNTSKED